MVDIDASARLPNSIDEYKITPAPSIVSPSQASKPSSFRSLNRGRLPDNDSESSPEKSAPSAKSGTKDDGSDISTEKGKGNGDDSSKGGRCDCTVNAAAGLVWWYPKHIKNAIGSVVPMAKNGTTSYSIIRATTTFDLKEAIESAGAYVSYGNSWNAAENRTDFFVSAITPPPPLAASTVFSTISAVQSNIPTGVFGSEQKMNLFTSPPIPTYVVTNGPEPHINA
jgi:hypothetical protein